MIIALDYDKTYTRDIDLWRAFIDSAKSSGHTVVCITMRRPSEPVNMHCRVYYTSRKAKLIWAEENNIDVDIWIDDKPGCLFEDAI